ncbi:MAG: hypothetical protein HY609_06345 [Deltaproteobacteria bacterium]|nr:hypothetical protein [Deltaproteobacteria bacterium]
MESYMFYEVEHRDRVLKLISEITTLLRAGGGKNVAGVDRSAINAIIRKQVFDQYFFYIVKNGYVFPLGGPEPPSTIEKVEYYTSDRGWTSKAVGGRWTPKRIVKVPNPAYDSYLISVRGDVEVRRLQHRARLEMLRNQYKRGEFGTEEAIRRDVLHTYPGHLKAFEANLAYAKRVAERIVSSNQREKGKGRDAIDVAQAELGRAFRKVRRTNQEGGFAKDFLFYPKVFTDVTGIEEEGNAPAYTVWLATMILANGEVKPSVMVVCRGTDIDKCVEASQENGLHIIDFTAERMAYEKRTGKTLGPSDIRMVMVKRKSERGNAEYALFVVPVVNRSNDTVPLKLAGDPIYGIVINPSGPREIRHGSVRVR